jgi:hypothetical protein
MLVAFLVAAMLLQFPSPAMSWFLGGLFDRGLRNSIRDFCNVAACRAAIPLQLLMDARAP